MFLDAQGNVRPKTDYLDIGRNAMLALLDTDDWASSFRYRLLQSQSQQAFANGPTVGLAELVGQSC